jgi:hypothetical protein
MSRAPTRKGWECVTHGGEYAKRGGCPACKAEVASGTAGAVDRDLKKNADSASYETDARSIAKILDRHYGDEADSVLSLVADLLRKVKKEKR